MKYSKTEIEKDLKHPCHPKKILEAVYYPSGVIKTDAPIIGVLTQPYSTTNEDKTYASNDMMGTYIAGAHVRFLE